MLTVGRKLRNSWLQSVLLDWKWNKIIGIINLRWNRLFEMKWVNLSWFDKGIIQYNWFSTSKCAVKTLFDEPRYYEPRFSKEIENVQKFSIISDRNYNLSKTRKITPSDLPNRGSTVHRHNIYMWRHDMTSSWWRHHDDVTMVTSPWWRHNGYVTMMTSSLRLREDARRPLLASP